MKLYRVNFRVKQISETEFIPQVRECFGIFKINSVSSWSGIQSIFLDFDLWKDDKFQTKYCCVSSLEKAMGIIEDYKKSIGVKVKYPKYFKA